MNKLLTSEIFTNKLNTGYILSTIQSMTQLQSCIHFKYWQIASKCISQQVFGNLFTAQD